MNISSIRSICLAMLGCVAVPTMTGAVSVSVSPAVTSNSYSGFISLNITGVTNFQPVKVQTYLDLNGNGVVDAGEPLIDVFNLQESGAVVVGGATNFSMPYDSNPATNIITATLNFAAPLSLENTVGHKIYRVIGNPATAFAPVTATVNVTNTISGQSVTGVIYSDGVTPLAYAVVVALTATNQNYIGAAVADASGKYQLALPVGSYLLMAAKPGYYTDQNLAPQVTLTSGTDVTNDISVTNGAVTISGTVYDAGNSNALGGIFLQASSGNVFGIGFTDTNGNYTIGVSSNNWKIKTSSERLARRGYLALQSSALTVNAAAGNVGGADIGLHRGNALFYGQLTISNLPVPNVQLEANDEGEIFSAKGYTDANGNYGVAVLADTNVLPAGTTWYCSTSAGGQIGLLNNFIFNQAQGVLVNRNQAYRLDLAGLPVSDLISGRLMNNLGTPIVGVSVGGSATINGLQYITAFVDTDTNGAFTFAAAAGSWYVSANCCGNHSLQEQNYYEPGMALVPVPPGNLALNLTAFPNSDPQLGEPLRISSSLFDFNLYGANGYNYTIQASADLSRSNWTTLQIITNLSTSPYLIQDNQATTASRFYRVLPGP